MKSASLNIAGKIDPRIVTVLDAVSQAAAELEMPYVVVGATARDLVLHYGHGARIQRATRDVDFAIEVPNWAAFNALKDYLCQRGFETTAALQRLVSPANTVLDIVPFVPIEDDRATIAWPPAGEIIMSVLGFREALESAEQVRIRDEPALDVPVATPAGMMLLKLIAWTDRPADLQRKDAMDIAYLLACVFPTMTDTIPERWRTLFRWHGGQCSGRVADIFGVVAEGCPP